MREATSFTTQSMPLRRFSPVMALQLRIAQWCVLMSSKASAYSRRKKLGDRLAKINAKISTTRLTLRNSWSERAPGRSCLLASTRRVAPARRYKRMSLFPPTMLSINHQNWPPLAIVETARVCSPRYVVDRLNQRPILTRPFAQSSFASKTGWTFVRPRPRYSACTWEKGTWSFNTVHNTLFGVLLVMLEGLNVEAKRRWDGIDWLAIDALENGGFACIIQAPDETERTIA